MDSFGGESGKGEKKVKFVGVGRGHRTWASEENTKLRRPHGASTSSQSNTQVGQKTCTQNNLSPTASQEEKKSVLSPQAAEFIPKSLQSHTSQSLAQSSAAKTNASLTSASPSAYPFHMAKTLDDRIRIARGAPCASPLIGDDSSPLSHTSDISRFSEKDAVKKVLDDDFTKAKVIASNIGNSNYFEYDQYDKEAKQSEKEEAYNIEVHEDVNNIIDILIVNPAKFDCLVPPFIEKLKSSGNLGCLQLVVTTIIEWSINESNFRYNGARFCKYFDTSFENCKKLFEDLLCFQCKWETGLLESEWFNQPEERNERKCNGLILFLAELVAQMDESYTFCLGELLVRFITTVLQKPAPSSVKYICQALKLAGHVLEKDKNISKDMENMMRALTELVNNEQDNTHVGNMVNKVHELRNDWRKNTSNCDSSESNDALLNKRQPDHLGASNYNSFEINTVSSKIEQPVSQKIPFNEPVMYGPDGEILSAEESAFLEAQTQSHFDEGTSEDEPDEHYDDDLATAFEQFLKESQDKCQ
ncbi:hypothetical protein PUN28_015839 [Cardiocondyla obscurior]|uniref:Polyadenylate-binding protein-interacting protein 1 n=1 Tax=Cardiocondyla obscurior TaxID=286306 RepID=A0AAW2EPE8_9HYME